MATWGDYTLRKILDGLLFGHSIPEVTTQPTDTGANSIDINTNVRGFFYRLQRQLSDGTWSAVGTQVTSNFSSATVSLTGITTSSKCRIQLYPMGGNANMEWYTNEFNVIRAGTQSTQKMDESMNTEEISVEPKSEIKK